MTFEEMFKTATEIKEGPYDYQRRIAEDGEFPSLIEVPTGAGKTAAVILGWLWRRQFASDEVKRSTPRRLVYCLPMRVLVEQTRDCVETWLDRLGLLGGGFKPEKPSENQALESYEPFSDRDEDCDDAHKIRVHLLMGGDVDRDWDMYPERDAILIGTQDMLLSRALNRGYAMSRYRWPVQFGLLNNDCLWVMDEVQLMGSGLATTTQLQAFRRKFGTVVRAQSVWMSATVRPEWLETVDFDLERDAPGHLTLSERDREGNLKEIYEAAKAISRAGFTISDDGEPEADFLISNHEPGTRTLMVVNTVKRAQRVYSHLRKKGTEADVVLLHSRFRPVDRAMALERLLAVPDKHGTIGICTQILEAGVDVSAKMLVTDVAPWPSLVQRFGRCNRKGEFKDKEKGARIVWMGIEDVDDPRKAAPYAGNDLQAAQVVLDDLEDAASRSLPPVVDTFVCKSVLRKKDIVDLFDTTPDLAGADIDISRFIREADEHDIRAFWRDIEPTGPSAKEPRASRDELCSISITDFRKFEKDSWRWDYLDKEWVRTRDIYPGLVVMLRSDGGGYQPELGWTGEKGRTQAVAHATGLPEEGYDSNYLVSHNQWQTIAEHTNDVVAETSELVASINLSDGICEELLKAARWHDAGKGHEVFQKALPQPSKDESKLWAKSTGGLPAYERRHFRHELGSGLVMLLSGHSNLAAYLAACHHGKIRLSIRSLPDEDRPMGDFTRFARGWWDGDQLPATDLGDGVLMPATSISLSYMELGDDEVTGPSWLARMLALRDSQEYGPFRLTFLEALIRVADWRASAGNTSNHGEVVDEA